MPPCNICGKIQYRRRRWDENTLVCFSCYCLMKFPKNAAHEVKRLEKIIEKYKQNFKIRTPDIQYRFNSPFSAIPPFHILTNAIYGLEIDGYYHSFSKVLADYYGIEYPKYYRDPEKVPDNAIACYHRSTNEVYSKNSINRKTAFHEMWHALESFGIVPYDPEASERDADRYAEGCVSRLSKGERT